MADRHVADDDATQPVPRPEPRADAELDSTRTMPDLPSQSGGARKSRPAAAPRQSETSRPAGGPPADYRKRLSRRIGAVVLSILFSVFVTWLVLGTVPGQVLDTMAMGAVAEFLGDATWTHSLLRSTVSVPVALLAAALIGLIGVARGRLTLAGRALGLIAGAIVTAKLLKALVERPDLGVTGALQNSLPSGHVTFVAALSVALVMVVPTWMRSVVAVCGWAATTLAGIAVMASSWHRLSDVIVAILVVGVWGLTLAPLEVRRRRDQQLAHWAGLAALGVLAVGIVVVVACTPAVVSAVSADGFPSPGRHLDPAPFLEVRPALFRILALGSTLCIAGLAGAVVHEVDRQARD